jgi:isoquinoline 1-oxidoreductase
MQPETRLQVNGVAHQVAVEGDRTLLSVLRDELRLTGTKVGCGEGKCGACTVLVDGQPLQACSVTAAAVAGKEITTIEGLAGAGVLHPLQAAFLQTGAFQCGYCTPGMIMAAAALLATNPQPAEAQIVAAMQDNICRCGSHPRIVAAIRLVAAGATAGGTTMSDAPARGEAAGPGTGEAADPVSFAAAAADRHAGAPTLDAMLAEGILVAYPCPDLDRALFAEEDVPPPAEGRPLVEIGPWLHVGGDGAITLSAGKAEVGQNIRTSLAQAAAEELRVPADAVRVVLGDTGRTPYDMGTFGSRTTPITGLQVRRIGAAARELLLDLAAATWNTGGAALEIGNGIVRDAASGRTATYAELVRDRQLRRIAGEDAPITPPAAWLVAGESAAKADGRAFVTGGHQFASDVALGGMRHGKLLRPPAFGAVLLSLDATAAEAMPGVTVFREGDFVGVTAPDEYTAALALDSLRAQWKTELQVSQGELFDYLKAHPVDAVGRQGPYLARTGSVAAGLAEADIVLHERYTVDYIAHAPLEPRVAVAQWVGDELTVWTGSQRPFGVRAELAAAFGLPERQVRVIVPDTGAAYGGKHAGDAAVEAARLARAAGAPVRLAWTRQEEFTWAYFRPAGLIEVSAGVSRAGALTAFEFHNYNSGAAGIEPPYVIPNQHIEFQPTLAPLRQGAYRALATTANTFARESFLDELAYALGMDPLVFRLCNLRDARLRAVLEAAAAVFGWDARSRHAARNAASGEAGASEKSDRQGLAGRGVGLACGADKGSYVAACAEVAIDPTTGAPQVLRVVQAFDCGAVINPDHVRSQVEGAIIQGLGGALFERVQFANGRILNGNFGSYRVPRFADIPEIETILLDRPDVPPAGAGETPIIAIAPAIANAIFDSTGLRCRALPLAPA